MASSYPIKNKNGVVYAYRVRVYRGRDVDGKQLKPYSTVWKIPDGMKNSRTIKKELDRFSSNNARKEWYLPIGKPLPPIPSIIWR